MDACSKSIMAERFTESVIENVNIFNILGLIPKDDAAIKIFQDFKIIPTKNTVRKCTVLD